MKPTRFGQHTSGFKTGCPTSKPAQGLKLRHNIYIVYIVTTCLPMYTMPMASQSLASRSIVTTCLPMYTMPMASQSLASRSTTVHVQSSKEEHKSSQVDTAPSPRLYTLVAVSHRPHFGHTCLIMKSVYFIFGKFVICKAQIIIVQVKTMLPPHTYHTSVPLLH